MLRAAAPLLALTLVTGSPAPLLAQGADAPSLQGTSTVGMAPNKDGLGSGEVNYAAIDPQMLARDLQTELKRLGCLSGEVDGDWGEKSKTALQSFARHAKLPIASDAPTMAALNAASATKERACPLVCDDDERMVSGRCIPKERKARREPTKERRAYREPAGERPRARAERQAEPREPSKPFKLCQVGGRQMAACD
jgi:hypothetical protein